MTGNKATMTPHTYDISHRKRYHVIDLAKGLAIVLVVIGHFFPDDAPFYYTCLHRIIYTFHMPLFMMASGFLYIATRKQESYLTFIRKKTLRLMLPYAAASIIILTIKLLTQGHTTVDHPVELRSFIDILYLPAAGYFLWFLWALWIMFLVVYKFTTRRSRILLAAAALIIAYLPIRFPSIFCLEQFRVMFIYFMTGIVLYDWKHCFTRLSAPLAGTIATLLFITGESAYVILDFNSHLELILPWVGSAFIIFLSMIIERCGNSPLYRIIMTISSYSFFIYLFHTTFMGPVKSILMKLSFFHELSGIAFIILTVTVVTAGTIGPLLTDKYMIRNSAILSFIFGQKPICKSV